jgi:hypothetical protein
LLENNPCAFTTTAYVDILVCFETCALKNSALGKVIVQSSLTSKYAVDGGENDIGWLMYATIEGRQSLSTHQALQWLLRLKTEYGDADSSALQFLEQLLTFLKWGFEHTCASLLEALVDVAPCIPSSAVSILGEALAHLACESDDISVQTTGRRLLTSLYERTVNSDETSSIDLSPSSMRESFSETEDLSPALVESTVLLWGSLMEQSWCKPPPSFTISWFEELGYLISVLRPLLHKSRVRSYSSYHAMHKLTVLQSFDLRLAAASSINRIPSIWASWTLNDEFSSIQLQAILLTYDILNDDDEELRDVGSSIATKIFLRGEKSSGTNNLVPLVASQQIAGHLVRKYRTSSALCRDAIRRMTTSNFSVDDGMFLPSSTDRLSNAVKEDTALFVIEKQNLFVNEVREAILWSQVLKKLSSKAISTVVADALTEWTMSGIRLLAERLEREVDGALGWCSKPDVFIFFMQVLCAADVLMCWRLKTKKVELKGTDVRRALMKLSDIGTRNGLHEMLIDRIERIIQDSFAARLGLIGQRLTVVERDLAGAAAFKM